MPTPKQQELIDQLLSELDMRIEEAFENLDIDAEELDDLDAEESSELIDYLLLEKRSRKD